MAHSPSFSPLFFLSSEFVSHYKIQRQEISEFCRSVGNQAELYIHTTDGKLKGELESPQHHQEIQNKKIK